MKEEPDVDEKEVTRLCLLFDKHIHTQENAVIVMSGLKPNQ